MHCIILKSQSLDIDGYGTWDRGGKIEDFSEPNVDFLVGIEALVHWKDVNKAPGEFNFSDFRQILNKAVENEVSVRFSIDPGPDAPDWIYDQDDDPNNNPYPQVRKVYTEGGNTKDFWEYYPYYLSDTFKTYYFELIEAFADYLNTLGKAKRERVAFVQVKTGCSGDEVPYKGDHVVDPLDAITDQQWEDFRLEVFNQFKISFHDNYEYEDKKDYIPLTYNDIDPSKDDEVDAWNWIVENTDPEIGFGIKGGAFNRGHHLSDEQTYKETLSQYLINPKGSIKIFSASEMDGTWESDYFAINTDMSFYWAALGGLNVGLSSNNLNRSSLDYVISHESTRETFRMFTKYAQQVYPKTAIAAMSVFHEGLNAADTEKFPENIYGLARRSETDRYLAIANDPIYKSRGARIDDIDALNRGQVYQRANQTGLNDVGWEISEGNIERFLYQIEPDDTSTGLFRVRGEIDTNSSKYDRFARSFENSEGKNTMYFNFDEEMFIETPAESLDFKIIWLDKTAGSKWSIMYKNKQGVMTSAIDVTGIGSTNPKGEWREVEFTISDALLDQSGVKGSDFTLVNTDTIDDVFNGIYVDINRSENSLSTIKNDVDSNYFSSFFIENTLNIKTNFKSNSKGNIKLFSINGQLLMSENVNLINESNLFSKFLSIPPGVYVSVITTNHFSKRQKLIKK